MTQEAEDWPGTTNVRAAWVETRMPHHSMAETAAEFDRWLAAHDAQVRAEAAAEERAERNKLGADVLAAVLEAYTPEGVVFWLTDWFHDVPARLAIKETRVKAEWSGQVPQRAVVRGSDA